MSFRFRNLDQLGTQVSIRIRPDGEGFLGRECPEKTCEGYFKLKPGTGLVGSNLPCHCPYCGHSGPSDHFTTKEQVEYARSMAVRQFTDALHKDLKSLEFESKPRGLFGFGLSMKVEQRSSVPIRYYREKALETHVVCDVCTLAYAIYGVFGYCPDCRTHNSLQILLKNHDLILKQVGLAETLEDADLRRHLTEDALENCVSSFDGFGRETCRVRASKSSNPAKCEKISFQNLIDAAQRLKDLFGVDLVATVQSLDWAAAQRGFMKRHVLAHRSGVVDAKYMMETSDPEAVLGRRVPVSATEVSEIVRSTQTIAKWLIQVLPVPS